MRESSVAELRYQAVLAVISDGLSISQVAQKVGVSRQTLHSGWPAMRRRASRGCWIGRIGRRRVRIRCRPRWKPGKTERFHRHWTSKVNPHLRFLVGASDG